MSLNHVSTGQGAALLGLLLAFSTTLHAQDQSALDAIRQQADQAYQQRDFPATIELANQILASNSQDHGAIYLRGSARVEIGIATGALETLRQGITDTREAIRIEGTGKPEYYLPYIYGMSYLAVLEKKTTHAETARVVADSVLERDDLTAEQRANLLYQRAHADLQLKEQSAAVSDLKAAIKLVPNHLAAHMMLADVTAKLSPAEGATAFNRLVEAFPDSAVVYNNRAMFLQSAGRTQEALADIDQALQLDPSFLPARINRGFILLQSGNYSGAEAALTQVLATDSSQAGAYSLRGTARLNQRKSAEALADYRQVVQMAPNNPMSHADLGFAQFFTGDFAGAASSFARAIDLNPGMRFLLAWRLAAEIRSGNVQTSAYQQALDRAPEARDWADHLQLFQLGRIDAQTLINGVNKTDTDARNQQLCEGYYFIGMELVRRGRQDDAKKYFEQAMRYQYPNLSAYRGAAFALGDAPAVR